jgi:hypothetical protein
LYHLLDADADVVVEVYLLAVSAKTNITPMAANTHMQTITLKIIKIV